MHTDIEIFEAAQDAARTYDSQRTWYEWGVNAREDFWSIGQNTLGISQEDHSPLPDIYAAACEIAVYEVAIKSLIYTLIDLLGPDAKIPDFSAHFGRPLVSAERMMLRPFWEEARKRVLGEG